MAEKKPRKPRRPDAQKPGRQPLPPDQKRQRLAVSLLPGLVQQLKAYRLERVTVERAGSESQIIESALRDYFGQRGQRDAEVQLRRLAERAARVLHRHQRDGIFAEVYHVLSDAAALGGDDWQDADFTPAPDELTRLAAENARLRRLIRERMRVTDAQIDEHLAHRPGVVMPDEVRDGTYKPEKRNSLGLPTKAEPFMG